MPSPQQKALWKRQAAAVGWKARDVVLQVVKLEGVLGPVLMLALLSLVVGPSALYGACSKTLEPLFQGRVLEAVFSSSESGGDQGMRLWATN